MVSHHWRRFKIEPGLGPLWRGLDQQTRQVMKLWDFRLVMATWTEYTYPRPRRVVEGLLGLLGSWKECSVLSAVKQMELATRRTALPAGRR